MTNRYKEVKWRIAHHKKKLTERKKYIYMGRASAYLSGTKDMLN